MKIRNNSNNKVTDNEGVADDAAIDNGDTMSEGTDNDNVPNNTEDGNVAQDLGDGVRDIGDGVGNAVEDVGDAVGDVIDGDAETR